MAAERLVVIGGSAGGMSAAANARRGRSDLDIVAFESSHYVSYAA
jgi:NADPH-dependent 2,4-dienoyl-CoA reductase/sulfur reductase-like enzyme